MPTDRQVANLDRAFKAISVARKRARLRYGTGMPCEFSIACPACHRGRVAVKVVSSGRISGSCSDPRCVSWTNM